MVAQELQVQVVHQVQVVLRVAQVLQERVAHQARQGHQALQVVREHQVVQELQEFRVVYQVFGYLMLKMEQQVVHLTLLHSFLLHIQV